VILTASHNPGGPTNDFGIKYNVRNGGPALEDFTNKIYEYTGKLTHYAIASDFTGKFNIDEIGTYIFPNVHRPEKHLFTIKVIDSTEIYVNLLKELFNFDKLKKLFDRKDFSFCLDGMHGVAGPYATKIFGEIMGCDPKNLLNCIPKEDFGNGHPDPNLTYAHSLVEKMDVFKTSKAADESIPNFGAACDGDADRNMILGRRFFVTPSDSVAILAANSASVV